MNKNHCKSMSYKPYHITQSLFQNMKPFKYLCFVIYIFVNYLLYQTLFTDTLSLLRNLLFRCQDAIEFENELEGQLFLADIVTAQNKSLLRLEYTILEMASSPLLCNGVLYCSVLKYCNKFIVRYIESGCFRNFMKTEGAKLISSEVNAPAEDLIFWQVYNHYDIKKREGRLLQRSESFGAALRKVETKRKGVCVYLYIYIQCVLCLPH